MILCSMSTNRKEIAIIMRSMNEQPFAERSLQALMHQSRQDFVLYNVDTGSEDETFEIVKQYNQNPDNIFQIRPDEYVPGRVLNDMCARTTEPIIVFLNADAIPLDEYWLDKLVKPLFEEEADAAFSKQIPRNDAYFIVKYDYNRAYDKKNIAKSEHFFSAVSCAIKRELWENHNFYTEGIAEDLAWSIESKNDGARIQFVDDAIVEHSHNYTLKQLYKRHYHHGAAYSQILNKRPELAKQFMTLMSHLARDLFYTMLRVHLHTIPYNILYRFTEHLAYYNGCRAFRNNSYTGVRTYKKIG